MRIVIDSIVLDNLLSDIVYNNSKMNLDFSVYIELLYLSGCRANDALEFNRWQLLANSSVLLTPQKGNNLRSFGASELPILFYNSLVDNENIFEYLSYPKVLYYLDELLNKYDFRIIKKRCTNHLFRHNYAKLLKNDGFTDIEIKDKLGEKNLSSAMQYINSSITYCQ